MREAFPTWGGVARQAAELSVAEEATLERIGRLPLIPARHLLPVSGGGSRAALYRCVASLARRGLIIVVPGPVSSGGPRQRLLLLGNGGLAVLGYRRGVEPAALAHLWGLDRAGLDALARELPAVLAGYELLALLSCALSRCVDVARWRRRWRPGSQPDAGGVARGISLAAYATLAWTSDGGQQVERAYVLVADTGGLSPAALRLSLARAGKQLRTTGKNGPDVVIATTSDRRVEAWSAVLERVSASPHGGPLVARVATWETWRSGRVSAPRGGPTHADPAPEHALACLRPADQRQSWVCTPRPIPLARVRAGVVRWDLGAGERAALDLIGRHAFLPTPGLGEILGKTARWARERRNALVSRGLVRVVPAHELPASAPRGSELLEATGTGLATLAGILGVPLAAAVRYHGLAGGGEGVAMGPRRALLAHLAHTLGTDAVFGALARSARGQRGGALLEWRNAAACAQGRVRPDGYGLLRLGQREHGFFLEFDRGTVRPAALRAKLAAYQRLRASARATRQFDSFPTLLIVTLGPSAEDRLADAITAADTGAAAPLAALLTTTAWIEAHPEGALGPIWRQPRSTTRCRWPRAAVGRREREVHRAG